MINKTYKVLIALTVTYITCCSSGPDIGITPEDCYVELWAVGFSVHSGLINYCFLQQFIMNAEHENKSLNNVNADNENKLLNHVSEVNANTLLNHDRHDYAIIKAAFVKFLEHVKDVYKKEQYHDKWKTCHPLVVIEYFLYIVRITAANKLKTPEEFCTDLWNTQPGFFTRLFYAKKTIPECLAEILRTEDGKNNITEIEKGKILRIDDGTKLRAVPETKIEYGEDKFKNAIKTNILSSSDNRNKIMETWPQCKKKYYNHQKMIIEENKKDGKVYLDDFTWCSSKYPSSIEEDQPHGKSSSYGKTNLFIDISDNILCDAALNDNI